MAYHKLQRYQNLRQNLGPCLLARHKSFSSFFEITDVLMFPSSSKHSE